ncbi:MAG: hypothetical protein L0154_25605 [Chloroflexi bacterium]|nr:hypothetical protein [Chloroflexota bacterium]
MRGSANDKLFLAGTRFSVAFLAAFVDDPDWPVEYISGTIDYISEDEITVLRITLPL